MEIEIRHATPEDYLAIHDIFKQPQVIWGTMQVPYNSPERWRKRVTPSEGVYSLVACVDGKVLAQLGVHANLRPRRKHVASLGLAVHDDWHGKGVGSALMAAAVDFCDNWLNIVRLDLEVYIDNEPAIRLYQKFGFEIEGTLKKYAFRGGQYVDAHTMARFRPE